MMAQLTSTEQKRIFNWYSDAYIENSKLVLKIVKYMSMNEVAMVCSVLESVPFNRTTGDNWTLERDYDTNILRCKPYAFHIDHNSCNVSLHLDGRLSNIGNNGYVTQYYFENNYAIPMLIAKGHECNGKTPFKLGIAIPNLIHIKDALNVLYDKDKSKIEDWFFDKRCHDIDLTNIDIYEEELTKINNAIANKR